MGECTTTRSHRVSCTICTFALGLHPVPAIVAFSLVHGLVQYTQRYLYQNRLFIPDTFVNWYMYIHVVEAEFSYGVLALFALIHDLH